MGGSTMVSIWEKSVFQVHGVRCCGRGLDPLSASGANGVGYLAQRRDAGPWAYTKRSVSACWGTRASPGLTLVK